MSNSIFTFFADSIRIAAHSQFRPAMYILAESEDTGLRRNPEAGCRIPIALLSIAKLAVGYNCFEISTYSG